MSDREYRNMVDELKNILENKSGNNPSAFTPPKLDSNELNELGVCYFTDKDYSKAFVCFDKAVKDGVSKAMYNLAVCYERGLGVNQNLDKAFIYYTKAAADNRNIVKQAKDKLKNMSAPISHYKPLSAQENQKWDNNLKRIYDIEYQIRTVYANNIAKFTSLQSTIYDLLLPAVKVGHAESMALFSVYCEAKDLDSYGYNDEIYRWAARSAAMGCGRGYEALAQEYLKGWVVEVDLKKALELHNKALLSGYTEAYFSLGQLYKYGFDKDGQFLAKDFRKAFEYFRKASECGSTNGMCGLAECYQNGMGIGRDIEKAKYWYKRAYDILPEPGIIACLEFLK